MIDISKKDSIKPILEEELKDAHIVNGVIPHFLKGKPIEEIKKEVDRIHKENEDREDKDKEKINESVKKSL